MKKILCVLVSALFVFSYINVFAVSDDAFLLDISFENGAEIKGAFSPGTFDYEVGLNDGEIPDAIYRVSAGASVEITKAKSISDITMIKVTSESGAQLNVYTFSFYGIRKNISAGETTALADNTVRFDTGNNENSTRDLFMFGGYVSSSSDFKYNRYGILRFDISDIPDSAAEVKLQLGADKQASGYNIISANDYKIGIYSIDGFNTTWKKGDNMAASLADGYNAPATERIGTINTASRQIYVYETDPTNSYSGGLMISGDITDYIREMKRQGKNIITLGVTNDEQTGATYLGYYMRSSSFGSWEATQSYRPKLKYISYPTDTKNGIKNIEFENGVLQELVSEDLTEYNVGAINPSEPVKVSSLALNSFFAAVPETEFSGYLGETVEIPVTSESGETKLYRFNVVSAADAGYSNTGTITVSDPVLSTKEMVADDVVSVSAAIQNKSLYKKKYILVTNFMRRGELISQQTCEYTAEPGYSILKDRYTVPEDIQWLSIVSYVVSADNIRVSETNKAVLGEDETAFEKREGKIEVYYKVLDENILTVSGKIEPGKRINTYVYSSDKSIEHYEAGNAETIFTHAGLYTADDKGYYGFDINMPGESRDYTISLYDGEGNVYEYSFFYVTPENKSKAIEDIFSSASASELKAKLDLKNPESLFVKYLQFDTSAFSYMNEDAFAEILFGMIDGEEYDLENLNKILELYEDALLIENINEGKIEDISEYAKKTQLSEASLEEYNRLSEDIRKTVSSGMMSGHGFKDFREMEEVFKESVVMSGINYPVNMENVLGIINRYYSYIGISDSEYVEFSKLNSVQKSEVVGKWNAKGPYMTKSSAAEAFSRLLDDAKNKKSQNYSSGGGGASAGGSFPASITVSGNLSEELNSDTIDNTRICHFDDLDGQEWAREAITALYEKRIIDGINDKKFKPSNIVKREEFLKMISGIYEQETVTAADFSDVAKDAWYYPYVSAAVSAGIIKGRDDGSFGAGTGLTREDAAVIIYRALKGEPIVSDAFEDDSEISDYAKDAVYFLKSKGLISGTGENMFCPGKTLNRAQAAQLIFNIMKGE